MHVRSSKKKLLLLRVRRRCLVCDFEDEREEVHTTFEIGAECARCHAPTERLAILGRRTVASEPNPHAAALGRLGGLKGGPARARTLSAARRRDIARAAAHARWKRRV
jgi:hypothetical protein